MRKLKLFSLALMALFSTSLWAETYVLDKNCTKDDSSNPKTHVWTVSGQTFTISPQHAGDGTGNYFKLSSGKTWILTLPDGFTITNLNIKGYTNANGKTDGEITSVGGVAQTGKTFPAKDDANLANQSAYKDGYDFTISQTGGTIEFVTKKSNQIGAIITITGTAPDCTSPEIAWSIEPVDGEVGAADFVASVTTTPAAHAVTWTSSNTAVATVSNGTIHYEGAGSTTITASLTYTGDDYCKTTVYARKTIIVPIPTEELGTYDKRWYYLSAVPTSNPDNGLYYGETKSSSGLYGIKMNSSGFAWFVKPAVAGTLRIGAYASSGTYVVNVYACNNSGEKDGDALGTLSTASAGAASATMDIAADVEGIRIERNTSSEGVLYFIEFIGTPPCAAGEPGDISKGALTSGTLTLEAEGSAVTGDTWYWQTAEDGTDDTYDGSTFDVTAAGTYYVRSYNTSGDCWSDAKSFTVTAADLVDNYTVIYKDGTTKLGSETVAVGSHPTGIENPTKEFYTFAAWQLGGDDVNDLDDISGTKDQTINLTARWNPLYLTESIDFEEAGNISGVASHNIVASVTGEYDGGKASENWAYKGWKIKSAGATVRFLVPAYKYIQFKFGYLNVAGTVTISGDATPKSVTGASKEEDNPLKYTTYYWQKEYDAIYTFTTGDKNAAVIKAIYMTDEKPTALDNTVEEAKAVKVLENGQVVIFKDGKYFNVLGIQIR